MPYLISCFSYSFFVSLSFALENVFLFWHNCVIILYIVEVIDELYINFALSILKLNLEAFLSVFWSQNWILLIVSIDGCFYIYIYSAFHIQWVGLDMFRERRGKFWIKKKKTLRKKEETTLRCYQSNNHTRLLFDPYFRWKRWKLVLYWIFRFDLSPFLYVLLVFSIYIVYLFYLPCVTSVLLN